MLKSLSFTKVVKLTKKIIRPISKVLQTEFEELSNDDKKKFKIKKGAKIKRTVDPAFREFGVGQGYILTKVNGQNVTSAEDAVRLIDGNTKGRFILEMINPNGEIERFRY